MGRSRLGKGGGIHHKHAPEIDMSGFNWTPLEMLSYCCVQKEDRKPWPQYPNLRSCLLSSPGQRTPRTHACAERSGRGYHGTKSTLPQCLKGTSVPMVCVQWFMCQMCVWSKFVAGHMNCAFLGLLMSDGCNCGTLIGPDKGLCAPSMEQGPSFDCPVERDAQLCTHDMGGGGVWRDRSCLRYNLKVFESIWQKNLRGEGGWKVLSGVPSLYRVMLDWVATWCCLFCQW